MNDLIGGQIDLFITTPPSAVGYLQAKTVKGLEKAESRVRNRQPLRLIETVAAVAQLPTKGDQAAIRIFVWNL
jgi:hypothetical protein